MRLTFILLAGILILYTDAFTYEGRRTNSILLNGEWQYAAGEGDEHAEKNDGQEHLEWRTVSIPGPFMSWDDDARTTAKFVWARRRFEVSGSSIGKLAVLRWNQIAIGAVVYINGGKVGENEPTGPYQVIIPEGILRPGENEIVLKIACGAGVRKSETGHFLVPAGLIMNPPNFPMPSIAGNIWIDFADSVYMKWALAIPNPDERKVTIRVTTTGIQFVENLIINAEIKPWPDGHVVGRGKVAARLIPDSDPSGGEHFYVEVPMTDFKPWTYEDCNLYMADLSVTRNEKILDKLSFRFGMREIKVKNGNYTLNGRNLWLRGSNLVHEWDWGNMFTGRGYEYLVKEAGEMSMNCFRTHTQPPPELWADICDEQGTMILAELPVTYNHRDCGFTADEYEIWHRNVLTDAAGWLSRLWNHPSVVMWVLSNESQKDNEWEAGPYRDFVLQLDPTRPTMRTGDTDYADVGGTAENFDIHTCYNVTLRTEEGYIQKNLASWLKEAGDRTFTNSEYMNIFKCPPEQWTGIDNQEEYNLVYAQLGMEHTEAMRRARLDCILPYMYAGWTKTRTGTVWRGGFAKPVSACWHSALSPVIASLDLFDPDYLTGQEVTTELYLINDSRHHARIHVDLLLTDECPEFIPEADCFSGPLMSWSYDFTVNADTIFKVPVLWKLPDIECNYWLTARTTGIPGRPVLSQRFVRAVNTPEISGRIKGRTFIILGSDEKADTYFQSKGLRTSSSLDNLNPEETVIIIWNAGILKEEEKGNWKIINNFAEKGGRVVILSTEKWDWKELCDISVVPSKRSNSFSRVFAYENVQHYMLSGIQKEQLMRWNGLPGTVALAKIEGPALENAEKILWASEPGSTVAAEFPVTHGKGKILFSQLDIQNHVNRSEPGYDPVAEKVFLNILGW